jgi:glycerophosphoryl diester phosphodiesterase
MLHGGDQGFVILMVGSSSRNELPPRSGTQGAGSRTSASAVDDRWIRNRAKLLSHRGRGFGFAEATPEAVRQALRSGIGYVEFDTRVARGGMIHVRHGTRIVTSRGAPNMRTFSDLALEALGVARLADLLKVAAETIDPSQHICIDIKDFGYEREHLDLVEQFSLGSQTIFVSWIPQSLAAIHAIAPTYPLILSYLNLLFLPLGADPIEAMLADRELRLFDYIVLGPRAAERPLRHTTGFQHALVSRSLSGPMCDILRASNGGICVPTWCVCDELDAWCARRSLRQWVFTANNVRTYERLRNRPGVEVIFSDDPLRAVGVSEAGLK